MQLIINFLQVISEGLASIQEFAYSMVMDLVNIAKWLVAAVEIGHNLVSWMPLFLREAIATMLGVYVALRIVGRD